MQITDGSTVTIFSCNYVTRRSINEFYIYMIVSYNYEISITNLHKNKIEKIISV